MATPASRNGLRDYCLRRLGHPVVEINVTQSQIEDRIDDALQAYQMFAYDGSVRTYLKHAITQTDKDNKYIPVPDSVHFIRGVLPIRSNRSSSASMFDIQYQLHMNDIFDLSYAGALSHYVQTKAYINLLQMVLNGYEEIEFSRLEDKIFFPSIKWDENINVGDHFVIDAYRMIDPTVSLEVYDDPWIKRYVTATIKKQWGTNLKKFNNFQLPGGIQIDGQSIYTEADEEVTKLEEELRTQYELPPDFFVG